MHVQVLAGCTTQISTGSRATSALPPQYNLPPQFFPRLGGWRPGRAGGHSHLGPATARHGTFLTSVPPELGSPDLPCSLGSPGMAQLQPRANHLQGGPTPPQRARRAWVPAQAAARGLGAGEERRASRRPAAPGSGEGRTPTPAPRRLPRVRVWGAEAEPPPTSTEKPGKLFLAWPPASFESLRPRPGRRWRQFPAINPEVN